MAQKLTEETLQVVEDCGAAEMPIPETLEIAELTPGDWKSHPEAGRRYKIGQLKTKMAIRQAIVKGARSGNPALLKAYQDFKAENEEAEMSATFMGKTPAEACGGDESGEFADI